MLETKSNMDDETIEGLQDLLQANRDSAGGFREVAEKVKDDSLKPIFESFAKQRDHNARELSSLVTLNHEKPVKRGTFSAMVHRSWIDLRASLTSDNRKAMLQEAERGEDHIKDAYENVLKKTAGSAANDVLQRQYAEVKTVHDKVKHLRDAAK